MDDVSIGFNNPAPRAHQLFNPNAIVRVASAAHTVESDNGLSSLIPRKRLILLEPNFLETSGHVGNYTCPYLHCPYTNYCLGFNTRVKRNNHMVHCPYRNGQCGTDSQMQLVNSMVEAGLNNNSVQGSPLMTPAGLSACPFGSLNTFTPAEAQIALNNNGKYYSGPVFTPASSLEENNSQCNISSRIVEPAVQLPEHYYPFETGVMENNNGTVSSTYAHLSGVANYNHLLESTTGQEGVQMSAEIGALLDNFSDGHLTAMDQVLNDVYGWIK